MNANQYNTEAMKREWEKQAAEEHSSEFVTMEQIIQWNNHLYKNERKAVICRLWVLGTKKEESEEIHTETL